MKKILMLIAFAFVVVVPAMAKNPKSPADENGLNKGNSNKSHLYLYEKDPDGWLAVEEGAWGKMTYDESGDMFDYVFNGHKLLPEMDYTLIYYPDPWPGEGLMCLGTNVSDEEGNVHLKNTLNTGDLPALYDWNHVDNPALNPDDSDTLIKGGAKIWLVLTEDVDCESRRMTGWSPTEYLFEYDVIQFDDTDTDVLLDVLETLENKNTSNWEVIDDDTYGLLNYSSYGPTFVYDFEAYGLMVDTDYSLIYYADGWPGNHPGALIGEGTTDGSGDVSFSGNPELNMNLPTLPDTNFATGAKVWLVPSSHYNSTTYSLVTFIGSQYLFETDFVNYIDTDL